MGAGSTYYNNVIIVCAVWGMITNKCFFTFPQDEALKVIFGS